MMKIYVLGSLLLMLFGTSFAAPQEERLEEIVVKSFPLHKAQGDIAQYISILQGDALRAKLGRSIGATLDGELGVSSASFGPGVGRPVIRGQGGPRVRVLQDGVGSLDVSMLSSDHAVSVEPILAERIEIIRGASTLLYGSGAIGGVVNVIDNRIPEQPIAGVSGAFEQRHTTASDENTSVLRLDAGAGRFAFHLDGLYRDSHDLEIPNFAIIERQQDDDDDVLKGIIDNSDGRSHSGTFGTSWIHGENFLGFAINYQDNNYGVPSGGHDHTEAENSSITAEAAENVRIDMKQVRYDLKGHLEKPLTGFEQATFKLAFNNYQHVELEGEEIGTRFDNEAWEARLELLHQPINAVPGLLGVQLIKRDFSAIGEEAFVPPSEIASYGFFLVQDYGVDTWHYDWGLRYERQKIKTQTGRTRSHNTLSISGSAIWNLSEPSSLLFSVTSAQRAPGVEELFAFGEHAATNSFDIGTPDLKAESSLGLELSLRTDLGAAKGILNLYYTDYRDFIYQATVAENVGTALGSCPETTCLQQSQEDAEFSGIEAELEWDVLRLIGKPLRIRVHADYVRATLEQSGDVPRIPPLHYGIDFHYEHDDWNAFLNLLIANDQNHPGANEFETEGYRRVDLGLNYYLDGYDLRHTIFFKGINLSDAEIRNSVSFLRDFAPESGRSVVIGYRAEF